MPRKPKTKPSIEPEAQQSDSDAAPEQSHQDSQRPTTSDQDDSRPDSNASTPQATQAENAAADANQTPRIDAGNVPAPTSGSGLNSTAARTGVRDRLMKHADWPRILATVREMRADSKLVAMKTEARERFIWGEMDRLYPAKTQNTEPPAIGEIGRAQPESPPVREGGVKGLGDIPPGWPPLPANAVLSVELGWVQANRLYVVEELPSGGTRVHLDRAHEPAPSRAAIGWLETSIRSYAKYVEVAAKVTGSGDEDNEQVKRERLAIEEIRELLREMAGNPPGPGR